MHEAKIRLNPDNVTEFVKLSENCSFDIDIFCSKIIIDAKSVLGVMGLDLSKVLTVRYYGQDSAFENMLHRYAAVQS
ncbi:MAG: HPr family phosphocarrier protein [Lachnospiraceae bacterium]|nr:HPr family phosphocarrier protein [Lachnospiraceae bacterium]